MVTVKSLGQVRRLVVFVEHFLPFLGSDRIVFELSGRADKRRLRGAAVLEQLVLFNGAAFRSMVAKCPTGIGINAEEGS